MSERTLALANDPVFAARIQKYVERPRAVGGRAARTAHQPRGLPARIPRFALGGAALRRRVGCGGPGALPDVARCSARRPARRAARPRHHRIALAREARPAAGAPAQTQGGGIGAHPAIQEPAHTAPNRAATVRERFLSLVSHMMRILLAQNSLYYPAHGGGDKSNRLLIEALAARGHQCRVVARISVFGDAGHTQYLESLAARGVTPQSSGGGVVVFERAGVAVHVVTNGNLRAHFAAQAEAFAPDVILVSTDDPAQLLLELALRDATARVVYLARATLALPFGPDCAFPSQAKTERIRACDAVVGVSQYVADYIRQYARLDAVHVPISLMEPGDWPLLGRFDNEFVTFVNPCAVKGIAIFLALDDAFPDRKSTRLNSSHLGISYAVFCLKKKKKTQHLHHQGGLSHAPENRSAAVLRL